MADGLKPAAGLLIGGAAGWVGGQILGGQVAVAQGMTGGLGITEGALRLGGSAVGAALIGEQGTKMGLARASTPKPAVHDMAGGESPIQAASEPNSLSLALQQQIPEEFERYKVRTRGLEELILQDRNYLAKTFQEIDRFQKEIEKKT